MLKYKNAVVTFAEVPEEVTLCINITGCPIHCKGCHSPELWENIGSNLTKEELALLIKENEGITCVCFMGGDAEPEALYELAKFSKDNFPNLKVGWYSGTTLRKDIPLEYFDYVKTGAYREDLGGLDSITTNQRFYIKREKKEYNGSKILFYYLEDITYKFQEK